MGASCSPGAKQQQHQAELVPEDRARHAAAARIQALQRGVAVRSRVRQARLRAGVTIELPDVTVKSHGEPGTAEYRMHFQRRSGTTISPWHDIALYSNQSAGIVNMVCEIPRMTTAKMEVNTKEANNPIAQDIKKGNVRHYHGPIFWNYGMLPQTWEDPGHKHPEMEVMGDNDPLDVVEIGSAPIALGEAVPVKVLGVLAMIDDGELDWKVIAIRAEDPLSRQLNDIGDVEQKCPGTVSGIREWLRWYKTPDGKPVNKFGFGERALGRSEALEVVAETHEAWERFRKGSVDCKSLWARTRSLRASFGGSQQQLGGA